MLKLIENIDTFLTCDVTLWFADASLREKQPEIIAVYKILN